MAAGPWVEEQWTVEDFTGALGGGPTVGPARAAAVGFRPERLCADKEGNVFLLDGDAVFIITPDGIKHRLAGRNDVVGYRDGPANRALFNQGPRYNTPRGIGCDDRGGVFVADNGNKAIRRLLKKDGRWFVDTWAGRGDKTIAPGQSCHPRELALPSHAIAVARDGTVTIATARECYRISPDGQRVVNLGRWPASAAGDRGRLIVMNGECDDAGNAYFVSREPPASVVIRVAAEGRIEHIAGFNRSERFPGARKPHHIGDGPPLEAYFDTPTSIAVEPDGSCVYVCGGDEYDIRRVPTDRKSTTATLLQNGRWHVMKVHPNRNRGQPLLDPSLPSVPRTEGGKTANLANCHILGRDRHGNLYGLLYSWVGATQAIAGRGPLTTSVYRLRRLGRPER